MEPKEKKTKCRRALKNFLMPKTLLVSFFASIFRNQISAHLQDSWKILDILDSYFDSLLALDMAKICTWNIVFRAVCWPLTKKKKTKWNEKSCLAKQIFKSSLFFKLLQHILNKTNDHMMSWKMLEYVLCLVESSSYCSASTDWP